MIKKSLLSIFILLAMVSFSHTQELKKPLSQSDINTIITNLDFPQIDVQLMYNFSPSMFKQKADAKPATIDDIQKDEKLLTTLAEGSVDKADLFYQIALDYNEINNSEKAIECLNKTIEIYTRLIKDSQNSVEFYLKRGEAYNFLWQISVDNQKTNAPKTQFSQKGFDDIKKASELDPNNPAIWEEFGSLYASAGQFDKAIEYTQKAIELAPQNSDYVASLLMYNFFVGIKTINTKIAKLEATKLEATKFEKPELRYSAQELKSIMETAFDIKTVEKYQAKFQSESQIEFIYHAYKMSIAMFIAMLRAEENKTDDNAMWIFNDEEKKQLKLAEKFYLRILQSDIPNKSPSYQALGFCYYMQGRVYMAVLNYRRAIGANPYKSEPYESIAVIYLAQGDMKKFEETIREKIKYAPTEKDSLILAKLAFKKENYGEATRICTSIIEKNNKSTKAWLGLVAIYIRQKNYSKARDFVDKAYAMDNDNSYVWLYGGVLALIGGDADNAYRYLSKSYLDGKNHVARELLEKYFKLTK